jgi:malate dehydrogenase (oxaloacetate-decarboxylating)
VPIDFADASSGIVKLSGMSLLDSPLTNRGTAFTEDERTSLGLHGLLPYHVESLEEQVARAYDAYLRKDNDVERHINLRALQDTNEVLFYRLLLDHIEEMTPIVYTPVVAAGCQQFSQIYRRPRGLFVSYPRQHAIGELLRNRPHAEVDIIVVTDGERILGIGDQGVGGLGIPIGKLSLYTLIGGIHPSRTLPVILDVGTNNAERLKDPQYLGWRHERITGQAYFDFVDQFVTALQQELPETCLQWEDFATPHARPLLEKYRDTMLTFNDDIQGTAAVAMGAIMGAAKVTDTPLREQKIVFLGAGSAGIGVADYLRAAMVAEGLTEDQARARFWMVDREGLLCAGRAGLTPEQRVYARADGDEGGGLAEVISRIEATVLIGLSTSSGAFTEAVVREMARKVARPIILPLSNPTAKSEATADDLIRWTEGRALVATGSPFAPVEFGGRRIPIAQCNNVYIFPAVGLGVVAAKAQRVTDGMMLAAARALGEWSPALKDSNAALLPGLGEIREVARGVALAVGLAAQRDGVAERTEVEELRERIAENQWVPEYS